MKTGQFETTVLNGFPVLVDYTYEEETRPEFELSSLKNGSLLGKWMLKRIEQAGETDDLLEEIVDHALAH